MYETASECARQVIESVPPVIWFMRRQMRGHRGGLSLPQFRTLVRIDKEPAASLSAVAEHLGSSLSTVSRVVAGLVKKGLLKRINRPDDRRQMALSITVRGRSMLERARRATQRQMEWILQPLTTEQKAALLKTMSVFRQTFGQFGRPDSNGSETSLVTPAEIGIT
jgi:DNA-binding MarR family transcriptional regulator